MNTYEELKKDFYILQADDDGYIYYLPEKKMVKVKREVAVKLQQCQEKEENISAEVIELLNIIKKQMIDPQEEADVREEKKCIKKLELIVSTICNLNCVYCYANGGTYNCEEKIMPFSVVDSLIENLKRNDVEIGMVQFFGGEPILGYKTISYVCHKFEEHHIPVKHYSMVSNFTFLPEEFIEDIIKYNIGITVSLDGPPEINNKQRIGKEKEIDVYHTVQENIGRLRKKGKDIKAIECTCTDLYLEKGYTKDTLIDFFQKEFAVKNIMIEDADFQDNRNTEKEQVTYFQSEKFSVEEGIMLGLLFNKKKRNSVFCGAGKNCFAIFPDGNIYPCHLFALKKEEYLLGNICDKEWDEKESYRKVLKKIYSIEEKHKCAECSARNCCSQCTAEILLNGENIDCDMRKRQFSATMLNYVKNRCIIHTQK